jgi:hypothetical protein
LNPRRSRFASCVFQLSPQKKSSASQNTGAGIADSEPSSQFWRDDGK